MRTEQQQVRGLMLKAGQDCPDKPTVPSREVRILRIRLIAEELMELANSFGVRLQAYGDGTVEVWSDSDNVDMVEAYDATIDLEVTVIGTGVAMGTDLEPGWQEVHRSNESKFIGEHQCSPKKWVKGPHYTPPNLAPILAAQQL